MTKIVMNPLIVADQAEHGLQPGHVRVGERDPDLLRRGAGAAAASSR